MSVSSNVLVLKEEEAFSLGSFVADCGGVLGLFVGFNFLMIWDCLVYIYENKIKSDLLLLLITNKLKFKKNIPTGSHLTQMSAGVPNLDDFLNLNNFGQNGQN